MGEDSISFIPRGLRHPDFDIRMLREKQISDVMSMASDSFLTVICGPRGSGTSTIANLAMRRGFFPDSNEHLWINLTDKTTLSSIYRRLLQFRPKPDLAEEDPEKIVNWLEMNKCSVVLDGLNHRNIVAINPLISCGSRQAGPSQVIITSGIRVSGANAYNIPPLNISEAIDYFESEQVEYNPYAVNLAFNLLEIWPRTLLGVIKKYGVFDADKAKKFEAKATTEFLLEIDERKRKVIWALIYLGPDFDEEWASIIVESCGFQTQPRDLVSEFEKRFLVKSRKDKGWEVRLFYDGNLVGLVSRAFEKKISTLGLDYFSNKINFFPNERFVVSSYSDAVDALKVVKLLQNVDPKNGRKDALFNVALKVFQSNGNMRDLQAAADWQLSNGDFRNAQWLMYKQANSQIYSGNLVAALNIFDYLFHELVAAGDDKDNQLYQSVIRQICQLLLYAKKQEDSVKILSTLIKTSDHSQTDHTVSSQLVALLATSLQQLGLAQECIDINQEILGRRMGGLSGKFSQHLSGIRIALALIDLNKTDEAINLLKNAKQYFLEKPDMKAHCWSSSILAATYLKSENFSAAEDEIRYLVRQANNEERQLSTVDLLKTYVDFRESEDVPTVQKMVQEEIVRISGLEQEVSDLKHALNSGRLISHVFLDLGIKAGGEFKFNLDHYEIYSLNRPYKIQERFSKNLANKNSKEEDEEVLDGIFQQRTPEQIFNTHLANKVIVNACKRQPLLARKYILPYIDVIGKNLEAVIFIYARCLEVLNLNAECLELLANIRNQRSFDYNNIMANALGNSNFDAGLKFNKRALKSLPHFRSQQRAQILNNMANLIHRHNKTQKYPLAIRYCKSAIPIIRTRNWQWPQLTLLLLQLEICNAIDVEGLIYSHQKKYRISIFKIRKVLPRIRNLQNKKRSVHYLSNGIDKNGFLKPIKVGKDRFMKNASKGKAKPAHASVKDFIVFALPSELHAAKIYLRESGAKIISNRKIGASYPVEYAEIDIGSDKYKFGLMCSGLTGSETMKALLVTLDNNVSPCNVILVGMMAGKKGKSKLLNVIAPTEIYDGRNLGTKNGIITTKDLKSFPVDLRLLSRLQSSLGDTQDELKLRIITDRKTASFGSTIDDIDHELARAVFDYDQKIIGLEMEGYALVQQQLDQLRNDNPNVQYIMIKGIADYAGEIPDIDEVEELRKIPALEDFLEPPCPRDNDELKERLQKLATQNALRVAMDLLKRYYLVETSI